MAKAKGKVGGAVYVAPLETDYQQMQQQIRRRFKSLGIYPKMD